MTAVGTRMARRIIRLLWKVPSISTVEPNVGSMFDVLVLQGPSMMGVDVGWNGNTDRVNCSV